MAEYRVSLDTAHVEPEEWFYVAIAERLEALVAAVDRNTAAIYNSKPVAVMVGAPDSPTPTVSATKYERCICGHLSGTNTAGTCNDCGRQI